MFEVLSNSAKKQKVGSAHTQAKVAIVDLLKTAGRVALVGWLDALRDGQTPPSVKEFLGSNTPQTKVVLPSGITPERKEG